MANNKKQFSLTLLIRILLATLIVVSIGLFAYRVMQYNALVEEKKVSQEKLYQLKEIKEELQELKDRGYTKEDIIRIAKEKWGLYFPDEEILIPE
ncbi:MAG: hypothetical protein IJW49_09090 [Clostridia bacterium]|nr:hypothetical protein [Clostridia bacterium]